jgi:Domain of unknown function DUF29
MTAINTQAHALVAPMAIGEMSAVRTKGLPAEVGASALYEADYYAWTQRMMQTLKARDFAQVDVDNLIEEVDDMGKNVRRGLRSHLRNLLLHFLKWEYQPFIQSWSWRCSINNARAEAKQELLENPSLGHQLEDLFATAYSGARRDAMSETGLALKTFPEACPYTLEQVLQDEWMPV